jgi:signal transduction histidine kinase
MLTIVYQLENKPDSTLKYLRIAHNIKDSLFNREKTVAIENLTFKEREKEKELFAAKLKQINELKIYALLGGLLVLISIAVILFRNNKQRQKAFAILQEQKQEIYQQKIKVEHVLDELISTQAQLIQSEKMASLGELTAGIAHEIQNPLNFVNNFSDVNRELITEMKEEIEKGNLAEVKSLAKDIAENEQKINHHGKRADAIVKGMLQHSSSSGGKKEPSDINKLADEYLRLAYHGLRAKDKSFNVTLRTDFDESIADINIIPQDIGRVILNLITNAFYAIAEKKRNSSPGYEPTVTVSTKLLKPPSGGLGVWLSVKDNGNGIPQKVMDKIFQPFFTTKPTGQGTGLGLSLSYDIVKAHGGEFQVETTENDGSTFIIQLPIQSS